MPHRKNTGTGGSVLAGFYRVVWECLTSKGTFERRPHSEHPPPLGLPGPPACPGLGLTSPHHSLLHYSAPGTLAFLLFLKPAKLVPTSEPFRFPFLLPGNLFLQIFAWLASSIHSGLCSSVRSSRRHSPTTLPAVVRPPRTPLCPSPCLASLPGVYSNMT